MKNTYIIRSLLSILIFSASACLDFLAEEEEKDIKEEKKDIKEEKKDIIKTSVKTLTCNEVKKAMDESRKMLAISEDGNKEGIPGRFEKDINKARNKAEAEALWDAKIFWFLAPSLLNEDCIIRNENFNSEAIKKGYKAMAEGFMHDKNEWLARHFPN